MAKKIQIRGVIVGSGYDSDWMKPYIAKGVLTPESTIREALTSSAEDVEIYINSQGGSVFAANEMINAMREFKASGKDLTITIGAIAASAAANLVLLAGASKIRIHENGKMMFHGAATYTEGGAGAHADSKELLARINAEVQTALVARKKLSPEQVAEWFSEGRMGWLTAKEALAAGLVDEIIGAPAAALKMTRTDVSALQERGLAVAALVLDPDCTVVQSARETELEAQLAGFDTELIALRAQVEGIPVMQTELDKLKADLATAAAGATQAATDLATAQAAAETATNAQAKILARAEKAERIVAKLQGGSLNLDAGAGPEPQTFHQAQAQIAAANPGMKGEDVWEKARHNFPALYDKLKKGG